MGQKKNSTIFSLSSKNAEWKSKYIEKNLEESSLLLYKNFAIWSYLNQVFKNYGLILYNWKIEYMENSINFFLFFFEKESKTKTQYKQNLKRIRKNKQNKVLLCKYTKCSELIDYLFNNILSRDLNLFFSQKTINIKVQNLNEKFRFFLKTNPVYDDEFEKLMRPFKHSLRNPDLKELIDIFYSSIIEKDSAKLIVDGITYYITKHKKNHGFMLSFFKRVLVSVMSATFSRVKGIKIVITGRFNRAQRSNKKIIQVGSVPLQSLNSNVSYYSDVAYTFDGTFGVKVWVCGKF